MDPPLRDAGIGMLRWLHHPRAGVAWAAAEPAEDVAIAGVVLVRTPVDQIGWSPTGQLAIAGVVPIVVRVACWEVVPSYQVGVVASGVAEPIVVEVVA